VLVDEVPHDLVENGGPHGADLVDLGQAVVAVVHQGVGVRVGRVDVFAEALGVAIDPCAHGIVGRALVAGLQTDGGCVEVAPAFAHTAGFENAEAA